MYYLMIREPQRRRPAFYVRTKSESATAKMWIISVVRTTESVPVNGRVVELRRFRKPELALLWINKMRDKYQGLSTWWQRVKLTRLKNAAGV